MTVEIRSPGLRPPLKWAGGKRWQVPYLRTLWRDHAGRRFVEPFCGGLAVALGLDPDVALLNDANPHLINFYRHVQLGLSTGLDMRNDERLFYRHRARFNTLLGAHGTATVEAAELFYYLNRTGYNGLCRFNRQGQFNVPFGRYTTIRYARDFSAYREPFARWTFTNLPFERLDLAPADFIYADPPYDVTFTQYARGGFTWSDQERTAEWLARHPGPVVLVNQATPRIERLYRGHGFAIAHLNGPRRISCTGDRAPAKEIVATRNL
jgi:DNA adenine methylase